jgi:hypothetical protein
MTKCPQLKKRAHLNTFIKEISSDNDDMNWCKYHDKTRLKFKGEHRKYIVLFWIQREQLICKCKLGVKDDKKGSLIFDINVCNIRLEIMRSSFFLGLQRNGLYRPVTRNMRS